MIIIMGVIEFFENVFLYAVIGAVIGGLVGFISTLVQGEKLRQEFKINKGMTYEQIVAIMGEPDVKTQKEQVIVCDWFKDKRVVEVKFVNNVAKRIGLPMFSVKRPEQK